MQYSKGKNRMGDNAGGLGQLLKGHKHPAVDFSLLFGGNKSPEDV